MATWYIVKRGAETLEKTFDTYEGAEILALGMALVTGEQWNVELAYGMAI